MAGPQPPWLQQAVLIKGQQYGEGLFQLRLGGTGRKFHISVAELLERAQAFAGLLAPCTLDRGQPNGPQK